MGRSRKPAPPPPPKAPPPPAEDVSVEVIAPTMRQEAARRARMGAYVTRGQKIGAGGQLLGAAPIQLANVRAAAEAGKGEKMPEKKTIETFDPTYTERIKKARSSGRQYYQRRNAIRKATKARQRAYDQYLTQFPKNSSPRKPISPEGGMTI